MAAQPIDLTAACRFVASTFYGERGVWLYDAFETINKVFFDGELPCPNIVVALTAHGKCLGWSASPLSAPPTICIHPSTFGGSEKADPWGFPPRWLGRRFVFDVLLHECIHVSVNYRLGGANGPTSHNNPQWIGEVNRIAPLLGFSGIDAAMSKSKRVPLEGCPPTKRGRQQTRVQKVTGGNVPFRAVTSFPIGLRAEQEIADWYYTARVLPDASLLRPQ